VLRYRSSLFTFSNLRRNNTARWENTFDIRASRFITTSFYWLFYFDELAKTEKPLQLTYAITVGLTYTFKNK